MIGHEAHNRPAITIRSALPKDAGALADLHVKTWQQAYAELLPEQYLQSLSALERLPMWRSLLESNDRVAIYVAEVEQSLIGFSCGGVSNDEDAGRTTGEMWSIYLLREFWERAIGKELHDVLLSELRARGFEDATLWVMESNDRTRRWYERQGWTLDGSRKTVELWGAPIPEIRYRKTL